MYFYIDNALSKYNYPRTYCNGFSSSSSLNPICGGPSLATLPAPLPQVLQPRVRHGLHQLRLRLEHDAERGRRRRQLGLLVRVELHGEFEAFRHPWMRPESFFQTHP